jgi:CHAT domain-containing protein/Tfp pilus assembly protein PilF
LSACRSWHYNPQVAYEHAYRALLHGDLKQARDEAHQECQRYRDPNVAWAWKFRTLEARAALQQGHYADGLNLLKSVPLPSDKELLIPILTLEGEAYIATHEFVEAERSLHYASEFCVASTSLSCGYLLKAEGHLKVERDSWDSATEFYRLSLVLAQSHGDVALEAQDLINLGYISLVEARYDQAIDWSQAGYLAAKTVDARRLELISSGNIGWAYYKLGDSEKALELSIDAATLAAQLADVWNQENYVTNIGYIYMDKGKFDLAAKSFQQALGFAKGINVKKHIYNALRVLARLSLQTGDLARASEYAEQALSMARQDNNRLDELYPLLVQGQIAARRGDTGKAKATFSEVSQDKICPVALKWEAEHSLARLYESENHPELADREYRAALSTFEAARDTVRHEDSQLSFLTNASHIYDDYVHFLVAQKKTNEALRWADYSRARTLAEGLGLLRKASSAAPPPLNAQQVSRLANGAILFYWLGEPQSYLWAITPKGANLFTLPPRAQIEASVQSYRKSLGGPQDVLGPPGQAPDRDGLWLYRTLIAPAQPLIKKDGRVFIIPDGALNNLNFETLIVDQPSHHFWIEDADVANASSLRVLEALVGDGVHKKGRPRRALLIGDSVAPGPQYPELPRAADQMKSVAGHFPPSEEKVLARDQATPEAYFAAQPEQFSYIHFVAHGTASRLSPLDSAIVLSKSAAQPDSFKLYARDIIRHPIHADLVTVSACYGAGERAYSGEGLVGLAWAFLRAGSHNVIAGLWEVTDASTDQLMDRFYDEVEKGASVDVALRAAKLSLLHGNAFHNPFYWAPFQLYTGS